MSHMLAWTALQKHATALRGVAMRDLFAHDPNRFDAFSASVPGLLLDYSKNRITDQTMGLLLNLAGECGVEEQRDAMFAGRAINSTESRAVLHAALRGGADAGFEVDGINVSADVADVLGRMHDFTQAIHNGRYLGVGGKRFRDVVAIGIGGSHLGPEMACLALRGKEAERINVHFISNVDGHDAQQKLAQLNPATTLVLVASKTFTTHETMTNAQTVKSWLVDALGADAVGQHFVALSTNGKAAEAFGIRPDHMFPFWDWVGGRYSLWSAIGLPIALSAGWGKFEALLAGARQMDAHFRESPMAENLPILLALVGVWNINFMGFDCLAVLPYDERLKRLPAFLQQLDMESNGKGVLQSGEMVDFATGPVVFGEPGPNGQHAFYQLLHQGPKIIPADFIAVARPAHDYPGHHDQLLANVLAQSQALMQGRSLAEADGNPHRVFSGNRPSNTLLMERLDAYNLGQLIALYEHKVFVQGVIWGINSFDQWGVELGKELASDLLPALQGSGSVEQADSSTTGLLKALGEWR